MTKKIRLIRTMVTEYVPNPEYYDKGMTIEEMAQSDAEQDDLETIFSSVLKDEVKWEIIDGESTYMMREVTGKEAIELIKSGEKLWSENLLGFLTYENYVGERKVFSHYSSEPDNKLHTQWTLDAIATHVWKVEDK